MSDNSLYGDKWREYIDEKYTQWKVENPEPRVSTFLNNPLWGGKKEEWRERWEIEFKRLGFKWGKEHS